MYKMIKNDIFVCLFVCLFLSGCSKENISSGESVWNVTGTLSEENIPTETMGTPEHGEGEPLIDGDAGEAPKLFLDDFSGYIRYAGNDKLLCLGDKVMLLDNRTLEVLEEIQSEELGLSFYDFNDCEAYAKEDGYAVVGEMFDEQGYASKMMVTFDRELGNVEVACVEELVGAEREIWACQLLENGKKILYSTIEGFYLYDSMSGDTATLDTGEVSPVLEFAFLESTNEILFVGNDANSQRVLGKLDLNDINAPAEIYESNLWGKIQDYGGGALIEEADVYGKEKSGQIFCYRLKDGILQYPLTSIEEKGFIVLSCNGEYYATNTIVQNEGYILRIYSSEDGQLAREYLMAYDQYGEGFRLRNVLICENAGKVILMVNGLQGQEQGTWLLTIDL